MMRQSGAPKEGTSRAKSRGHVDSGTSSPSWSKGCALLATFYLRHILV